MRLAHIQPRLRRKARTKIHGEIDDFSTEMVAVAIGATSSRFDTAHLNVQCAVPQVSHNVGPKC